MPLFVCLLALLGTLFATLFVPALAQPAGVPANPPALAGKAQAGAFRTIKWEALVPPDWNPMAEFKGLDFTLLDDGDPRAVQMLKRIREVWDQAPVNKALVGQAVRIPGFVVPLEDSKEGMKEFLLVPYFGACIHSPPPPANQIIHVRPANPAKGIRSMDPVWISGVLGNERTDSGLGVSGWQMSAQRVERYEESPPPPPAAATSTKR